MPTVTLIAAIIAALAAGAAAALQRLSGREAAAAANRSADAANKSADSAVESVATAKRVADLQEKAQQNQRDLQDQLLAFQRGEADRAHALVQDEERKESLVPILQRLLTPPRFPSLDTPVWKLVTFLREVEDWMEDLSRAYAPAWRGAAAVELRLLVADRHKLKGIAQGVTNGVSAVIALSNRANLPRKTTILSIQDGEDVGMKSALAGALRSLEELERATTEMMRRIRDSL